jgi:hypothetical protein
MPRDIDPSILAQFGTGSFQPALFTMITFASGTEYLWTGNAPVYWNNQVWTGTGSVLGFSTIQDSNTVDAKGISITLSAIDATLLPLFMTEYKLGLPVVVYLGVYAGGSLIPFPITAWAGNTDKPTVRITGPEATITMNCENTLVDMNVPGSRRYTNDDQQMTWPGDLGMSFVSSILEKQLFWGIIPQMQNTL